MNKKWLDQELGAIAVELPGSGMVLEKLGLDYCVYGKKTLQMACFENGIESEYALELLGNMPVIPGHDWLRESSLSVMVDHILKEFHEPAFAQIELLEEQMITARGVYALTVPALSSLHQLLLHHLRGFRNHMLREEQYLFPLLRETDPFANPNVKPMRFGTLSTAMRAIEDDHGETERFLTSLSRVTDCFTAPSQVSGGLDALYSGLCHFASEMRRHINFENYILLPHVVRVEQMLLM
jgi:regulator of cell morphogenesis and NO signaling